MRILMFGWEFPPHISGGLGTACYGLTKGLTQVGGNEVIFVVPCARGNEPAGHMELIGADHIRMAITEKDESHPEFTGTLIGVSADIIPYTSPEDFWKRKSGVYGEHAHFVGTHPDGTIHLSGKYGPGLLDEVRNYALIAAEIAKEHEFDVIHAHDWLTFPAGLAASEYSGKPLVLHVHATEFDRTGGQVNTAIYSIEREGMEKADKVIAVSNLTRKTIIEKYGIAPHKVTTVYNAVEPLPEYKKTGYHKIPGEKTVTFLGRITLQKGPEYFVEAALMVLKRVPYARFVMAGSGDMLDRIIEQAARLGIAGRFHFTGFLEGEEVYQLLDVTDVFVMPSVSEPFGIAPLEAMLAGVPVIISKQSGVAEIVSYACKIDFWDTLALADAIYGLIKYNDLAGMLAKHGAIEAASLQWKHSAGIISGIYSELVSHDRPVPGKRI